MTEKQLQTAVVKLATLLGWLVFHPYDSRRSKAGYPDLTMVRERVLWVELKSAIGTLSDDQKKWKAALEAAGEEYYLWRPADWDNGTIVKCLMRGER